jgi:hypothetical protein
VTDATHHPLTDDERVELETLRARVAELETQRALEIAAAHRAVADAQNRAYWIDKMNIDLNEFFASPAGRAFWWVTRRARRVLWALRRRQRRVKRWLRIG